MSVDGRESVFSRWSRRKLAAKEQQENTPESAEPANVELLADSESVKTETEQSANPEAPVLTDSDMPDIETLTAESDYSPFMSSGVSEELRKLALRKLFQGSVFNMRDGLDDYDDDFTSFEKLGDVVTSDMKHRIEMEQQKLREKLAEKAEEEQQASEEAETVDQQVEQLQTIDENEATPLEAEGKEEIDEQY